MEAWWMTFSCCDSKFVTRFNFFQSVDHSSTQTESERYHKICFLRKLKWHFNGHSQNCCLRVDDTQILFLVVVFPSQKIKIKSHELSQTDDVFCKRWTINTYSRSKQIDFRWDGFDSMLMGLKFSMNLCKLFVATLSFEVCAIEWARVFYR